MAELSPARIELLKRVVDVQERMLNGCVDIFEGLSNSEEPSVYLIANEALKHLRNTADVLDALIDGLNATHH